MGQVVRIDLVYYSEIPFFLEKRKGLLTVFMYFLWLLSTLTICRTMCQLVLKNEVMLLRRESSYIVISRGQVSSQ